MAWWSKKSAPTPAHVETVEEFWAKRDKEREEREAQAKREAEADDESYWEGYAAPILQPSDGDIWNYELSAYSDKVGYYADGIERVCPIRRE